MFEFLFTAPCAAHFEGIQRSRYTARRLKKLARIAATLQRPGWPTWMTISGLAFEAVGVKGEDCCEDCYFMRTRGTTC